MVRMTRVGWMLALAVLMGLSATPILSQREPTVSIGLQASTAPAMLPHVQDLGIRHVRVPWTHYNTPADWRWHAAYRRAGIEVLPIVFGRGDLYSDPERVARSIVDRYRGLRAFAGPFPYVQLDNEVDGEGPFAVHRGDPHAQGRRWGRAMQIAALEIKRLDPGTRIVSAGIAWNREGVREWLRGVVQAAPALDVMALHVYGVHVYGEPLSRYRAVRESGWKGPIWATEIGVSHAEARFSKADPDRWQLENLQRVLTSDPSRHGYDRIYWFQLPADLPAADLGWSLLRPDGRPRPAYLWLRDRFRG